jgi:hypothetical protein
MAPDVRHLTSASPDSRGRFWGSPAFASRGSPGEGVGQATSLLRGQSIPAFEVSDRRLAELEGPPRKQVLCWLD